MNNPLKNEEKDKREPPTNTIETSNLQSSKSNNSNDNDASSTRSETEATEPSKPSEAETTDKPSNITTNTSNKVESNELSATKIEQIESPIENNSVIDTSLMRSGIQERRLAMVEHIQTFDTYSMVRKIVNDIELQSVLSNNFSNVQVLKDPEPYLIYRAQKTPFYNDNINMLQSSINDIITKPTAELMTYGTANISIEYNPNYFTNAVDNLTGLPKYKGVLKPIGYTDEYDTCYDYVAGILMMLLQVMRDGAICQRGEVVAAYSSMLSPNLIDIVNDPFIKDVGVNPALLSVIPKIKWLQDDIRAKLQYVSYKIGKQDSQISQGLLIKRSDDYAINIDHFRSTILNINADNLHQHHSVVHDKKRGLEAHAFETSRIVTQPIQDLLPSLPIEPGVEIRALMLLACKYPRLETLLQELNINYLRTTNIFRIVDKNFYYPDGFIQNANTSDFRAIFSTLIGTAELDTIHQTIAREISPTLSVRHMVEFETNYEKPDSIIIIITYILFSVMFPVQFEQIKGLIQNELLRFFGRWFPTEASQFLDQYGTTYTIDNQGRLTYSSRNQTWTQDLYLSNQFPALFSGDKFQQTNIDVVMKMFSPKGISIRDSLAISAKFPRLKRDNSHYIPFRSESNFDSMSLVLYMSSVFEILNTMTVTYMRKLQSPAARRTVISEYINHLVTRLQHVCPALTNHLSHVYKTMANHRLNFTNTFNGNHRTYKADQYAITSKVSCVVMKMIRNLGFVEDGANIIDVRVVWPILMSCESPLVRSRGYGTESVAIDEYVIFPDPGPSYSEHEALINKLLLLCTSDAFLIWLRSAITFNAQVYDVNDVLLTIVSHDQYELILRPLIEEYYDRQPLQLANTTTIAQVRQFIDSYYPLVIFDQLCPEAVLEWIMDNNVSIIPTRNNWIDLLQMIVGDFDDEYYTNAVDAYALISRIPYQPSFNEYKQLRELMPSLTSGQYRNLQAIIANKFGVDAEKWAMVLIKFLSPMKTEIRCDNPEIRRIDDLNNIQPYNDEYDIEEFRFSHYFLSSQELRRLQPGLKMVIHERLRKLKQGLRFCQRNIVDISPDFIPQPTADYVELNYSQDLFVPIASGNKTVYALMINGVPLIDSSDWPKIHLNIETRQHISEQEFAMLTIGIEECDWIVDVQDIYVDYKILVAGDDLPKIKYIDYLTSAKYQINTVYLRDTQLDPGNKIMDIPRVINSKITVFPLFVLDGNISLRGLVTILNRAPPGAKTSTLAEMDTGSINITLEPTYSDGSVKYLSNDISMSNVVRMYSNNIQINSDLPYEYIAPRDVYDLPPIN